MGLFAEWQPRYADHGVATFPMNIDGCGKAPAVRCWQRVGLKGSGQLALKFDSSDSFAFCAGRRSGIMVVDIDDGDEDLLRDTLKRYGHNPIVVLSGSGNFHLWYRFNGEPRMVRADASVPVDILGAGPVVAPPSLGRREAYRWLHGSLADVERLPLARNLAVEAPNPISGQKVPIGQRNKALFTHLLRQAPHADDLEALLDVAHAFAAEQLEGSLSDAEVRKTTKSAWKCQVMGQLGFRAPATVRTSRAIVAEHAARHPNAFALLNVLQMHHAGLRKEFAVSNAMASSMGWSEGKFGAARSYLLEHQLLTCVHRGGRGPGDPAKYRF